MDRRSALVAGAAVLGALGVLPPSSPAVAAGIAEARRGPEARPRRNAARGATERPLALVTGACGGIGGAVAEGLAAAGHEVICACRTVEQGRAAALRLGPAGLWVDVPCDLADLRCVHAFVEAVLEGLADMGRQPAALDTLVLAAGVIGPTLREGRTAQGHELNFGVNHLGHFALTHQLLPTLRASQGLPGVSEGARVIAVSSTAALDVGSLALEDYDWRARRGAGHEAYCASKAMNVLFAYELARREHRAGSRVTAFSIHPGPAATVGGVRYELPQRYAQRLTMDSATLARQARQLGIKTAQEAAAGPLWLATAPGFWPGGGPANGAFYTATPPDGAEVVYRGPVGWQTADNASALWELSSALVTAPGTS